VQLPTKVPVGARLLGFAQEWDQLTSDSFVTSIVREGYQIELLSRPPLSTDPIPMPWPRNSHKAQTLRSEIRSLVDKRAVEEMFSPRLSPGFYSHIFLVPKKDGGCRPVFNLKPLNRYVAREKFKMKTQRDVTTALHAGDWAVRIDLTDAYFHVPIHLKSRHLLRFALQMEDRVRVFQFRALPFGLTSAPRVFTRVILPVAKFAHLHGLHLIQYLDDWILKHQDRASLIQEIAWLKAVICKVGLVVNEEKSQFVPTQRFVHIGIEYHLDVGLIFPPMDRILKIESSIRQLQTVRVTTARFWLSLLGLLNSAVDAIPLGRLHLRPLQIYLLAHWAPTSKDLKALIPVKLDLLHDHLAWWQNRAFTRAGMFLDLPDPQTHLFTDASTTGWGAHLETAYTMGTWTVPEAKCHINLLELLAVKYALLAFQTSLQNKSVLLMSDNSTVVAYLHNQGGTKSIPLYRISKEILLLAHRLHMVLQVKHIPGERNALADLLSRKDKVIHTEWTLKQAVVDVIFGAWGKPNLDLFATRLNNRLPVWVSPMADPQAVGVDALSMSWKGMFAYAFPPFVILGKVLEKALKDHPCELILVAPKWPNQSWYARLLDLLVDFPLRLPLRDDLLCQPHNKLRHQSLPAVCLHAWRLSSDRSKREDFHKLLQPRSPGAVASPHELFTTASGDSSLVGVRNRRLILSKSLFPS